jgi:hypothetical protein
MKITSGLANVVGRGLVAGGVGSRHVVNRDRSSGVGRQTLEGYGCDDTGGWSDAAGIHIMA